MALLLAMYQKMKLVRERNQLQLEQAQASRQYDRVQKQMKKVQKRYTSLIAQVEKQAETMKKQAKSIFQNMAGIGTNSFENYLNPYNFNGMNGFIQNAASNYMTQDGILTFVKDKEGNYGTSKGLSTSQISTLWQKYYEGGGRGILPDGNKTENRVLYACWGATGAAQDVPVYANGITQEQVALFNRAIQMAQQQQAQTTQMVQYQSMQYDDNVSIWVEARKTELEAEQEAALEPLSYQETMYELEKTHAETRLKMIETEIQNYTQLVSKEAENAAPSFGLR